MSITNRIMEALSLNTSSNKLDQLTIHKYRNFLLELNKQGILLKNNTSIAQPGNLDQLKTLAQSDTKAKLSEYK